MNNPKLSESADHHQRIYPNRSLYRSDLSLSACTHAQLVNQSTYGVVLLVTRRFCFLFILPVEGSGRVHIMKTRTDGSASSLVSGLSS